jgi:hypothetical protein
MVTCYPASKLSCTLMRIIISLVPSRNPECYSHWLYSGYYAAFARALIHEQKSHLLLYRRNHVKVGNRQVGAGLANISLESGQPIRRGETGAEESDCADKLPEERQK